MIASDIELVYENCETVTVKKAAIREISIELCSPCFVDTADASIELNSVKYVRLKFDTTGSENFSAGWKESDPIDVLKTRRDISVINYDCKSFHPEWYSSGMRECFSNAYQDPTAVSGRYISIIINAERPEPSYVRGLWASSHIYLATNPLSNMYTHRLDVTPIRGTDPMHVVMQSLCRHGNESSHAFVSFATRQDSEGRVYYENSCFPALEVYRAEEGCWDEDLNECKEIKLNGVFPTFYPIYSQELERLIHLEPSE